jgi:MoxR-like ATPase
MAQVIFQTGPQTGKGITLPEDGVTFGRSARAQVVIDDKCVSGEHLAIRRQNGAWWAFDLNSSNGTRVNGAEIRATMLKDGDVITIGDSVLVFQAADGAPAAEIPPAASKSPVTTAATPAQTQAFAAPAVLPSREGVAEDTATVGGEETADDISRIRAIHEAYKAMKEQLAQVVVGQSSVIDEVLMAIFSRGHALLVGVPGLAKTLLVSTLGHVLDLAFKRIQFTPDLMPSDITGTDVLEEDRATGQRSFRFVPGPVFTNLLLADEINRTPPKTQAALLEAMQEHRVTVGAKTYFLPEPFFVLATQNPIEQEGTYPLPEAQLDRFMFNIIVDYPSREEEARIIRQVTGLHEAKLEVALNAQQVLDLQQTVRRVPVADHVIAFANDLARATRPKSPDAPDFVKEMVSWGAGPRAGIYLITAAKARAILQGRYHATTADVAAVALPVLRHRIITTFNAEAAGVNSDQIVRLLLERLRPAEDIRV